MKLKNNIINNIMADLHSILDIFEIGANGGSNGHGTNYDHEKELYLRGYTGKYNYKQWKMLLII